MRADRVLLASLACVLLCALCAQECEAGSRLASHAARLSGGSLNPPLGTQHPTVTASKTAKKTANKAKGHKESGCALKQHWSGPNTVAKSPSCRCDPLGSAKKGCTNPLAGIKFWNDPSGVSLYANDAARWIHYKGNQPPRDAEFKTDTVGRPYPEPAPFTWDRPLSYEKGLPVMKQLAEHPETLRVGPWIKNEHIQQTISDFLADTKVHGNGGVPVIETYYLATAKCDWSNKLTESMYTDWISKVAAGIGDSKVIFLLEGDSGFGCPHAADFNKRKAVMKHAVSTLMSLKHTVVYIDVASRDGGIPAEEMARRFFEYSGAYSNGMFVGSTHNEPTPVDVQWGVDILSIVASKYKADTRGLGIIISTATNGIQLPKLKDGHPQMCNAKGRAVGHVPTTNIPKHLADKQVHAAIWIGHVGGNTAFCFAQPRELNGKSVGDTVAPAELKDEWQLIKGSSPPTYEPIYPHVKSPFVTGIFDPNIAYWLMHNGNQHKTLDSWN